MVGQPLPAHRAEVAQEVLGIAATSSTLLDEGASNHECEASRAMELSMGQPEKSGGVQGMFEKEYRQTGREV